MQGTQLLTAGETAQRLGVSLRTIRAMIARGELAVVRVAARAVRIDVRDLEQYVRRRRSHGRR